MRNDTFGPFPIADKDAKPEISVGGQLACLCVEVSGTMSAGSIVPLGIVSTVTAPLIVQNVETGEVVADNAIVTAGLYWVTCAAIQRVIFAPSDSYTGTGVSLIVSASECLPPTVVPGT